LHGNWVCVIGVLAQCWRQKLQLHNKRSPEDQHASNDASKNLYATEYDQLCNSHMSCWCWASHIWQCALSLKCTVAFVKGSLGYNVSAIGFQSRQKNLYVLYLWCWQMAGGLLTCTLMIKPVKTLPWWHCGNKRAPKPMWWIWLFHTRLCTGRDGRVHIDLSRVERLDTGIGSPYFCCRRALD